AFRSPACAPGRIPVPATECLMRGSAKFTGNLPRQSTDVGPGWYGGALKWMLRNFFSCRVLPAGGFDECSEDWSVAFRLAGHHVCLLGDGLGVHGVRIGSHDLGNLWRRGRRRWER